MEEVVIEYGDDDDSSEDEEDLITDDDRRLIDQALQQTSQPTDVCTEPRRDSYRTWTQTFWRVSCLFHLPAAVVILLVDAGRLTGPSAIAIIHGQLFLELKFGISRRYIVATFQNTIGHCLLDVCST